MLRACFQNSAADQRCRSSFSHAPDAFGELSIGTSDRCRSAECTAKQTCEGTIRILRNDITQSTSIIRNARAFGRPAWKRTPWHASFGRDASTGCISHGAVRVGCSVRLVRRSLGEGGCPQRTKPQVRLGLPCAEDSALYSSVEKISPRSVCITLVG